MVHKLMVRRASTVLHGVSRTAAAACVCLILVTAACGGANADVEKAQIAVRANPDLELIATDERQGVLTVGVKSSGQTITVKVTDVLNGTAFRSLATASAASRAADQASVAVASSSPTGTPGADIAAGGRPSQVPKSEDRPATKSGASVVIGSSKRGGIRLTSEGGGEVRIGGRSSSVDVQSASRTREPRPSPTESVTRADPPGRGAVIDETRLERRTRPIFCVGSNSEDLNNVLLRVDDVAIASDGACEIRIRNSYIIGNTTLKIAGATNVSIDNSIIEGRVALRLEGSPNVSVRSSTIRGAVEKSGAVNLADLGGNLWR